MCRIKFVMDSAFIEQLNNINHSGNMDRSLFQVGDRQYSALEIKNFAEQFLSRSGHYKSKNIALVARSNIGRIIGMIGLEGLCSRLLIMPPEVSRDQQNLYFDQMAIDLVVDCTVDGPKIEIRETAILGRVDKLQDVGTAVTEWVIPTSGTSASPKLILHTLTTLTKTVKTAFYTGRVWALCYDTSRFAGMQVFFQSFFSGDCLALPRSNTDIHEMVHFFELAQVNCMSATPSLFRKAMMSPSFKNLNLKNITLGGEIVDQAILNALGQNFPEARVRHIYASTEVGVGFSVKDKKAGFPSVWLEEDSLELPISLKLDEDSRLQLKLMGSDIFLDSGDIIEVKGDRAFFLGRDSGSLNVGGNKVHPEEVESTVLELDFIKEARAFGKKSPIMGSLVCLEVVLKESSEVATKDAKKMIRDHCKQKLDSFKVPAFIKVVDGLNISSTGKLKRGN